MKRAYHEYYYLDTTQHYKASSTWTLLIFYSNMFCGIQRMIVYYLLVPTNYKK